MPVSLCRECRKVDVLEGASDIAGRHGEQSISISRVESSSTPSASKSCGSLSWCKVYLNYTRILCLGNPRQNYGGQVIYYTRSGQSRRAKPWC
jgi:hypothetical protein